MIKLLISITGLILIVLGYQVAVKYNYKLIAGYGYKKDEERYPIEIEKKYLRHIGFPLMIVGLFYLIMPLTYNYDWYEKATIIVPCLLVAYVLIVPNYIVKKELKKLEEN